MTDQLPTFPDMHLRRQKLLMDEEVKKELAEVGCDLLAGSGFEDQVILEGFVGRTSNMIGVLAVVALFPPYRMSAPEWTDPLHA